MNFIDPSTDHLVIAVAVGLVLGYCLLRVLQVVIGLIIAVPLLVLGYCAYVIDCCADVIGRGYLSMKEMDQAQKWIVLAGFIMVMGAAAYKFGSY
jgi:hypothetical protein